MRNVGKAALAFAGFDFPRWTVLRITGDTGRLPDKEERVRALAWRPAWSIRSRRGTIRLLSGLFNRT